MAKKRYRPEEIISKLCEADILIGQGREGTWIPVERGEDPHRMIPGSTFCIIPNSGHLVIEERSDQIIQEISSFLKEDSSQ